MSLGLALSHLGAHLLLENCLDVTVDFCSSARGFSQQFAADVAGYLVYHVAENELFVTAFLAFNPQEDASGLRDKFIPFRHNFLLR